MVGRQGLKGSCKAAPTTSLKYPQCVQYYTMSNYTLDDIREKADHYGEFMLVLESDREYDYHNFTVTYGDESDTVALRNDELRIEGMSSGEFIAVDIPVGRIEHVYAHREV